ncbi:MAG: prephenate dehydrogenase [Acidiferrobacteraceae bacterium]
MKIRRAVIVGVGLMGGSLARALKARDLVEEVVGVGHGRSGLESAIGLKVIDRAEDSLERAVRGADLVVLATPVGAMASLFRASAPGLSDEAIITDVGSVKESVTTAARAGLGARFMRYVPGHPIAGAEQSGVAASRADLFSGRRVVLTPVSETAPDALRSVTEMWEAVGAHVQVLPPRVHDEILALTSHLPHLLAFSAVGLLGDRQRDFPQGLSVEDFAGSGFCDFTRIAASDPAMWRDICLHNRGPLAGAVAAYRERLDLLAQALEAGDGTRLFELFDRARVLRLRYQSCADPSDRTSESSVAE